MEEYINNDTLIENEVTKFVRPQITCPLCNDIFINPLMCMGCQTVYCKKCIDNPMKQEKKCNCENPNYQICKSVNDLLPQLKFNCVGCGKEIQYDEAQKHHDSCCPGKTSKNMDKSKFSKKVTIEKLTPEEVSKLKKKGAKVKYITGNYNLYF